MNAIHLLPLEEEASAERQKRALFLINGEHYAGAERVQDLLALHLPSFGWRVDFVCLKPRAFEDAREARGSNVIDLPMRSHFDLTPVREVTRLLRQGGYDVLHTHTVRSLLIGYFASGRSGKPMVHHVHSRTDRDTENARRNAFNSMVQRFGLRRARRLIAVSGSTGEYLRELGYEDSRISVIPNGVPSAKAARDWHAPRSTWTIGMAALFRPRKGVEVLIEVLAVLHAQGRPVRLRAVGGFENEAYRQQVLAFAEAKGVSALIDWTGFTRDVTGELARMDLFVVPSLYGEGLPMVMLEAMAAGLPVVASSNEGMPEVLDYGATGVLVPPGDVVALTQALDRLIESPDHARALSQAGLQRQRERYSETAMARQVAAVYRELCQQSSHQENRRKAG